jgi:hypothetical protein
MTSMYEAHKADYAEKHRMDDLRHAIEAFLADPPQHLTLSSQRSLELAAAGLAAQSAQIVRVWD